MAFRQSLSHSSIWYNSGTNLYYSVSIHFLRSSLITDDATWRCLRTHLLFHYVFHFEWFQVLALIILPRFIVSPLLISDDLLLHHFVSWWPINDDQLAIIITITDSVVVNWGLICEASIKARNRVEWSHIILIYWNNDIYFTLSKFSAWLKHIYTLTPVIFHLISPHLIIYCSCIIISRRWGARRLFGLAISYAVQSEMVSSYYFTAHFCCRQALYIASSTVLK